MKQPKALIIDDDPETLDHVAEVLESLGHGHEQAGSLQQARRLLAANSYAYIILNLTAPARSEKGIRRAQNGFNFLEGTLGAMGDRAPPVITLVDGPDEEQVKHADLVELAAASMAKGAAYAVTKPLKADGRALDKAIKKALAVKRPFGPPHKRPPPVKGAKPRPFEGGELAFYADRVELCGVPVLSDMGVGMSRAILEHLANRNDKGRFVRISGAHLARLVDADGGVGTVTGCIGRLRRSIAERLRDEAGLTVGNDDVIVNDRRFGYCLKDWIKVRKAAAASGPEKARPDTEADADEPERGAAESDVDTVTARQRRILAVLGQAEARRAPDIAAKVECSVATVKREMHALKKAGLAEFLGPPKTGHYRLTCSPRP